MTFKCCCNEAKSKLQITFWEKKKVIWKKKFFFSFSAHVPVDSQWLKRNPAKANWIDRVSRIWWNFFSVNKIERNWKVGAAMQRDSWRYRVNLINLRLESISPTYYVQLLRRYFFAKKVQTLNLSAKKLCAKFAYKKAAHKMLMKLTPGQLLSIHIQTKAN